MSLYLPPDPVIDLQIHTTYSDGRWSAEQLFDYLAQEGFGLVAVTDHDRVDTVAHVQELGRQKQLHVLAAVEISAAFHGKMADLLCFGFDPQDQTLIAIATDVRQRQKHNAEQVYAELLRRGYQFPQRQTQLATSGGELRVAGDCGTLLLKEGYVKDAASALALVIDAGYREMKADLARTVEAVHQSGGVALIAHPGRGLQEPQEFTYYTPELLDQVRAEIPLDGIEVYYPTHTPELIETYLAYAQQHNLLVSAGSDSHGPPGRMPIKYPAKLCQRLLGRLNIELQ
ncbi:PHP domain-containing protein [Ktedonosporobacter rubrisoli]|uniref:PHP domain-containing protein n=1 Tax=Ktedonosporobacter rubrisoli TaxID=2509675 RepID=A0A4P6JIY9_KTERU|nr:PHP domain-containing protein [Ktedonosporobacter rubrisoli]QBD74880.1 PHP domain-containing protein [Ktedonosporobacter rubrisoli]